MMAFRFKMLMFRLLGLKQGPYMFPIRDYWIFVDTYQRTWKIVYTGHFENPLMFMLIER